MKNKFLVIILVMSAIASFFQPCLAAEPELMELYASRNNVYLTFSENPSVDTEIIIKNADGEEVSFSKNIQEGNVLRLTPSEKLNLDERYTITIGEEDKAFKIKAIASEDFSDNSYTETLDFYKVGSSGNTQSRVGILDGKLYMQQRYLSYFTLKDGLVDTLKNYTVEFDMETYYDSMVGIMFNKTIKDQQFRYGTKKDGVDEIGWTYGNALGNYNNFLYRYERTDAGQTPAIVGSNSSQYQAIASHFLSTYKITYDDTASAIGLNKANTSIPPQSINYTVDKMGKTGVLSLDNIVKDVYSKDTAAETGYFFIGSTNSWNMNNTSDGRGIALDNIVVTTCEELASGISIASISMKDSSGNTIDAVGGVDTIKGNVVVANLYEKDMPVTVVIGAYIDDTMINSAIINTADVISAGATMNCSYELTGVTTANKIKVFVWDSFENMVPYGEASVK